MTEAEGSLVVFTPSGKRPHRRRDEPARCRALARGRPRLRLRGPRHLRPVPGGRRRGRVREARHHVARRPPAPFSEPEARYRERSGLAADRSLGCHARVTGDLVVDVPPESQLHRQVVRKEADAHPIEVDPVVRLHYVEVREPDLADPSGDLQRLASRSSVTGGSRSSPATPRAHVAATHAPRPATGRSRWPSTTATMIAMWPGFHDVALGVAFDVGSTTVAGHLCDLHTGRSWRAPGR